MGATKMCSTFSSRYDKLSNSDTNCCLGARRSIDYKVRVEVLASLSACLFARVLFCLHESSLDAGRKEAYQLSCKL